MKNELRALLAALEPVQRLAKAYKEVNHLQEEWPFYRLSDRDSGGLFRDAVTREDIDAINQSAEIAKKVLTS